MARMQDLNLQETTLQRSVELSKLWLTERNTARIYEHRFRYADLRDNQVFVRVKYSSYTASSYNSLLAARQKFDYVHELVGKVEMVGRSLNGTNVQVGSWVSGFILNPVRISDYVSLTENNFRVLKVTEPRVDYLLTLSTGMVVQGGLEMYKLDRSKRALVVGGDTEYGMFLIQYLYTWNVPTMILKPDTAEGLNRVQMFSKNQPIITQEELLNMTGKFDLIVITVPYDYELLKHFLKARRGGLMMCFGMKECGLTFSDNDSSRMFGTSLFHTSVSFEDYDQLCLYVDTERIKSSYKLYNGLEEVTRSYQEWSRGDYSSKPVICYQW